MEKHNQEWAKREENNNFEQKHEVELAKQRIKPQVEEEIKEVVDEMIEVELDNARQRYGIKKPKKKKPKKKKKGGKKKKLPGDAQNRNRDPKDILAGLVDKGVVKKLMPATLQDIIGEANVLGSVQEKYEQ